MIFKTSFIALVCFSLAIKCDDIGSDSASVPLTDVSPSTEMPTQTIEMTQIPYSVFQGQTTGPSYTTTIAGNNVPTFAKISAGQEHRYLFPKELLHGSFGETGSGVFAQWNGFTDTTSNAGDFIKNYVQLVAVDDQSHLVKDLDSPTTLPQKRKRQQSVSAVGLPDGTARTVYISLSTCSQPDWVGRSSRAGAPLQLQFAYSAESFDEIDNRGAPDPFDTLSEGSAHANFTTIDAVYVAVRAPIQSTSWVGEFNYTIAMSIDDYFDSPYLGNTPFYLVDTDTFGALLVTDNLTRSNPNASDYQAWMELSPPPFDIFLRENNEYSTSVLEGLSSSYCALQNTPGLIAGPPGTVEGQNVSISTSLTTRGLGNKPKQQFHITGLSPGTRYSVYLARTGNSTTSGAGVVGGGGLLYPVANFTTKQDGNCQLVYNLSFCDTTAYAVPSNPNNFPDMSSLASYYDEYASLLYTNFSLSLQLIPCNTSSTSAYSPSKNCDDCAAAYKSWLCAVTIPRCVDFSIWYKSYLESAPTSFGLQSLANDSNTLPYLQPRNVAQSQPSINDLTNQFENPSSLDGLHYQPMPAAPAAFNLNPPDLARLQSGPLTVGTVLASNSSRVPRIDVDIQPGAYLELLPCDDICYNLVASCPAALGFSCPKPGRGLEVAYGNRGVKNKINGGVRCNYAGAVYVVSDARSLYTALDPGRTWRIIVLLFVMVMYI